MLKCTLKHMWCDRSVDLFPAPKDAESLIRDSTANALFKRHATKTGLLLKWSKEPDNTVHMYAIERLRYLAIYC